jgi:hypothetical protein
MRKFLSLPGRRGCVHGSVFALAVFTAASPLALAASVAVQPPAFLKVVHEATATGLSLVNGNAAADLYVGDGDYDVVKIATDLLATDVHDVSGQTPAVRHDAGHLASQAVLIGTIGHNEVIDQLIANGKLDVSDVKGRWESFKLAVIEQPLPGVERALVIVGSDRRGTAYGVFDLSERIGVSPWHWWADVPPAHESTLVIEPGVVEMGPPSVQYRGIFINDEDWGMEPWAAKTFEPEQGNIGPKVYEKVFELLLRLKGNYLWPAMHPVSTEFGRIEENSVLADKWGIVMGASHTEAMNRNNVSWPKENKGEWRYDTNRGNVLAYWEEWAKKRGGYEAVWTLGIRGVHDAAMLGPKDPALRVKIVEDAIHDQRELLKKYVNPDLSKVAQVFTPYKEVLALYQRGMKVPDDVTIMWTDDNYGYIRQLSTDAEQKRAGGAGIYYHESYLGDPRSYVWLNTTPPSLMWEEMEKAYSYGAQKMWVLNVGDLKPVEIGIDFWMHLGWDVHAYDQGNVTGFVKEWAGRTFGEAEADKIGRILNAYYLLGFQRKPEAMDAEPFSLTNYQEADRRMAAYQGILREAEEVNGRLRKDQQDAFYELVLYPVKMSALVNATYIDAAYCNALAGEHPAEAAGYAKATMAAQQEIETETAYYNEKLVGGKWNHMMTAKGTTDKRWGFSWAKLPETIGGELTSVAAEKAEMPAVPQVMPEETGAGGMFVEKDGAVSMNAGEFTRHVDVGGAGWQRVAGLGRMGEAIVVLPANAPASENFVAASSSAVEYDFRTTGGGDVELTTYAVPTHRIHAGLELRFAVAVDGEKPQVVNVSTDGGDEHNAQWKENVLRNAAVLKTHHHLEAAGMHTLKVWRVDPGVVLDKFVVDLGGVKPSYLGPPETR